MKKTIFAVLVIALVSMCCIACGTKAAKTEKKAENTKLSSGTYTATIDGTKVKYKAAYLVDGIDATISSGTYKSASEDEVVFLVCNGGSLNISDATVKKTNSDSSSSLIETVSAEDQAPQGGGTSSGDNYNFYGTNSAIVVVGKGSTAKINGVTIKTASEGSNAVFATGSGKVSINDTLINTTENSSRGLDATYDGAIKGKDMTISTKGEHCADLATDRGGGTVSLTGTNKLSTVGDGSPIIYSTGDISADGVTGTAAESQAIVTEGKNSAKLTNSKVTVKADQGIMMYQSMSGDAADEDASSDHSTCVLENTEIVTEGNYPMIYITNATAKMTLKDVTFTSEKSKTLIKAASDRWGTSGSNGGKFTLTASGTTLKGKIAANSISTIKINLKDGSKQSGSTSGSVTVSKK